MYVKPPKFEVDQSWLEKLDNDPRVVRHERSAHFKESSFSDIPVMPGTDILELMGRGPDPDIKKEANSSRC
ncbi:MAG: hypothetical protein H0V47_05195 [Chloroflexia bacterium]|jgi:hypothetical protein|nr:hypothetical protein [Chloroflexia bacterium]